MSWLFSRALVVAFSEANSSDGAACALWNGMPMPQACLWHGKTTAAWSRFPSGMTCVRLTDMHGEAVLTWFLAGFPAKTFPVLAKERESMGSEAGCGWRWPGSSVRWDRATCSWRTRQCSLFGGLEEFSGTWWRWGMMRSGECWELMMPVLRTEGNESGSWDGDETWQTPTAQDANGRTHHNQRDGSKRASLLGQVAMWPTVRSSDGERGGRRDLIQAVRGNPNSHYKMWPTPKASAAGPDFAKLERSATGISLATAVAMFPTPTAQDASNNGGPAQMERNALPLNAVAGGALNPTWVEWLMGWPLGWTDCGASGMDRFRQWCGSHGVCWSGCGVTSMTGVTMISEHAEA
jgi:hypothetical protein